MVYCQKCGASNTDDARFCNMCGAPIAQAGEPGGPLPEDAAPAATMRGHDSPADKGADKGSEASTPPRVDPRAETEVAPPPSHERARARSASGLDQTPPPMSLDVSTVSLAAIGVRSRGKAWAILLGVAAAFIGLGAIGMWLALNMNDAPPAEEVAEAGEVEPPAPSELEEPLPEGDAPVIEAGEPTIEPARSGRGRSATPRPSDTSGRGGRGAATGSTGSGSAGSGSSGTGPTGTGSTGSGPSGTGSTGTGSTGSGSSGGGATEAPTETGSTGTGSPGAGSTGTGSEPDWESMEEGVEDERDLEMDVYSGRLRQFIQTYYMRRAATCFDMATRNHPELRGRVTIAFTILADGTTRDTSVESNQTGVESIGGCLVSQVSRWRLPPPPEGEAPLAMSMPFRGTGM